MGANGAQRVHTDCSERPRRLRLIQNAAAQDVGKIVAQGIGKVVALRENPVTGSCSLLDSVFSGIRPRHWPSSSAHCPLRASPPNFSLDTTTNGIDSH